MAYNKGDLIAAARTFQPRKPDDWYGRGTNVPEGTVGTVTSVRSGSSYHVKFEGIDGVRKVADHEIVAGDPEAQAAANVERERLAAEKAEAAKVAAAAAAKAAAAEKAKATPKPGDIMPDDPRLAWLWAKIEQNKTVKDYCGVYDRITDELGIPGRLRKFGVSITIDGLTITAQGIEAHSTAEAEGIVKAKYAAATATKVIAN